jgi:sugar phosphate isomerase/epimerase
MGLAEQHPVRIRSPDRSLGVRRGGRDASGRRQRVSAGLFRQRRYSGEPQKQDEVIRRLKRVAPKAEKAGVVLGIESWMNADEHLRIVDAVASPAVRVYYDVANMTERGYDVPGEIRRLGTEYICQIHMKENGNLLGRGKVDFPRVKRPSKTSATPVG